MTMKAEDWAKLVREWRGSGDSAREFARAHGVTDTALRYWGGRLGRSTAASGARQVERSAGQALSLPALARVVRPGEPWPAKEDGAIMVVVGNVAVAVRPGFDPALLREVVRTLAEAG
jgi:hypothetical protein